MIRNVNKEAENAVSNAKSCIYKQKYGDARRSVQEALQLNPDLRFGFEILVISETLFYAKESKEWEERKEYGNPFAYSGIDYYSLLHLNSTATISEVKTRCENLSSCLNWGKKRNDGFNFPCAFVAVSLIGDAKVVLCDQQKRLLFDQTRETWALVDSSPNSGDGEIAFKQAYLDWEPPGFDANCNNVRLRPVKKPRTDYSTVSSCVIGEEQCSSSPVSGCVRVGEEISLESREDVKKRVFDAMPQTPHYHPLDKYKGRLREGMVKAFEAAFVDLSEEIRNLVDPQSLWSRLKGFKEQLTQLEEMGFNVTMLRERLDKLQEIAKREQPSQVAAEEFKADIRNEEAKISFVRTRIMELEGDIEKSKVVIDNRRCKIEELKKDSFKVVEEFKSLAKSTWN
ncbi:hypothetical protein GIB67_004028 [Kingdonia uniflora]|uniref:Uncharacterized protein n=1 Tax=Kingdonia uniflora TaxID=39325 RepID=A0A7J7NR30_9MAGN|nr:hypothetical protein GIB67_004028 [Kingdonia uniflora]